MSVSPRRAWIAIGSNLGDRGGLVAGAVSQLRSLDGMTALVATEPMETAPLGGLDQPVYLNAMVRGEWAGTPEELLASCHRIESAAGRDRSEHWGSRTLDLDLVRFDGALCDRPGLTLPHPGLRDRPFWAAQLATLE